MLPPGLYMYTLWAHCRHDGRVQWSEQGSVCSPSHSSGDLLAALAVTGPLVTSTIVRFFSPPDKPLDCNHSVKAVNRQCFQRSSPGQQAKLSLTSGRHQASELNRCSVDPTSRSIPAQENVQNRFIKNITKVFFFLIKSSKQ